MLTLALPNSLLTQREDDIEAIIEAAGQIDVDGFYIVAEPPHGQYLVDNPLWLSNLLQLCAGLKLSDKKVVVGYGNHQLLSFSLAGVDAIASGTWLNVRRFTNKFDDLADEIKRKSTWYYCPQALSEYKIAFLDIAFNNGILDALKPPPDMASEHVDVLFSGAMPSSTTFSESSAFRHYIQCLRSQVDYCSRSSFAETMAANELLLASAERSLEFLEKNGIYAQTRSFRDVIDVNRSAIQRLKTTRGFALTYSWAAKPASGTMPS